MKMAKGPWEKRVGILLDTFCPYKYKPVDSPMHGGAVRLDWLAMDQFGTFIAIEVKQLAVTRVSFNLENPNEMRPLQIEALNSIAEAKTSMPVLVIGQGQFLYVWGWRHVWAQYQWRKREAVHQPDGFRPEFLPLSTAAGTMRFTTDKDWKEYSLAFSRALANGTGLPKDRSIARTLNGLVPLSSEPDRLAWITRQGDCIPTLASTQRSELSSSRPGVKSSSSGSSRTGGMKSLKIKTFGRLGRT